MSNQANQVKVNVANIFEGRLVKAQDDLFNNAVELASANGTLVKVSVNLGGMHCIDFADGSLIQFKGGVDGYMQVQDCRC